MRGWGRKDHEGDLIYIEVKSYDQQQQFCRWKMSQRWVVRVLLVLLVFICTREQLDNSLHHHGPFLLLIQADVTASAKVSQPLLSHGASTMARCASLTTPVPANAFANSCAPRSPYGGTALCDVNNAI
jgi:hypothetical protein